MNRAILVGCALLGAIVALVFVRDWLATGQPFLIAMALFIAGCGAYAAWQAANLAGLFMPVRSPQPAAGLPAGSMIAQDLSKSRAASVRRIVATLAAESIFAPDVPNPASLHGPIAERDDPPNQEVVLTALFEAEYYDEGFVPDRHMQNLAFHDSKSEQFVETIAAQIEDLRRLAGPSLRVEIEAIDHDLVSGPGPQPDCRIALRVDGEPLQLQYRPAAKYLSTVLHVALAQRLREKAADRRLAWLWNDQGAWLAALPDGAVERLNSGAGKVRGGHGGWEWVDLCQPVAAGEL